MRTLVGLTGWGLDSGAVVLQSAGMARHCTVPETLTHGPFTLQEALAAGLTRSQLRGSAWRRISFNWYRWAGCVLTEEMVLTTIHRGLPEGSAFSGRTAARLHDLEVTAGRRPEATTPPELGIADRIEATVRRVALPASDIVRRHGFPVTSPLRTAFDLAGRLPLFDAVVAVDMALHAGLVDLDHLREYVNEHADLPGVARARHVLQHAEPLSESPMESRLRMLLVLSGLPRPQAQVDLFTRGGAFVARADLYYPDAALAVEYDGDHHRNQLVHDNRRQNQIEDIGVALLRYTAADLAERRDAIVAEVGAALRRRSTPSVRSSPSKRAS